MSQREHPDFYDLGRQIGGLQSQVGEISKILSEMRGTQEARHDENRQNIEKTTQKISDFKHEVNNTAQRNDARMGNIEKAAKQVQISVDKLEGEVHKLRDPVDKIIEFKNRAWWITGIFFSIGCVIWFFVQPIWSFLYHRLIVNFFHGVGQ